MNGSSAADSLSCGTTSAISTAGTVNPQVDGEEGSSNAIIAVIAVGLFTLVLGLTIRCLRDPKSYVRGFAHHKRLLPPVKSSFISFCFEWLMEVSVAQLLVIMGVAAAFVVWVYTYYLQYNEFAYVYGGKAAVGRAFGELSKLMGGLVFIPMSRNSLWGYIFGSSFER